MILKERKFINIGSRTGVSRGLKLWFNGQLLFKMVNLKCSGNSGDGYTTLSITHLKMVKNGTGNAGSCL